MAVGGVPESRGGRRKWLLPVILGGIVVLAGMVAYLSLIQPSGSGPPVVSLGYPLGGGPVAITVESVSSPSPLASFTATLLREDETVGLLEPLADGATGGTLAFADTDHDGRLTAGDVFTAEPVEAGAYSLKLLYRGTQVAGQGWSGSALVAFAQEFVAVDHISVDVAGASPPTRLSEFGAVIARNGTEIGRVVGLADGAVGGNLTFSDFSGPGKLTAGDRFTIASVEPGTYRLTLLWRGTNVTNRTWTLVPPPPSCSFGTPAVGPTGVDVTVAACTPRQALTWFHAQAFRDGNSIGLLDPLSGGASDGNLSFIDIDAGGTLSSGDRFHINTLQAGTYELNLFWTDGTLLQSVQWSL